MKPIWETLDDEVERTNQIVMAIEVKIAAAVDEWGPDALRINASKGGVSELYALYKSERTHLARSAKQSLDAGTAKLRVLQARTNAEAIARVLTYALDSAGLSEDLRAVCVGALSQALSAESRGELLSIEDSDITVQGELVGLAGSIEQTQEISTETADDDHNQDREDN